MLSSATMKVTLFGNQQPLRTKIRRAVVELWPEDTVPPVKKLNEIFGRFGALHKAETQVLKSKKYVKLVQKSSGKFSLFGLALVSYYLDYKPTPQKIATEAKKCTKSARAMHFEN